MPTMVREAWTDQRLDDLQKHMDEGFREVKAEIRSLRAEVRGEVHSLRTELKGEMSSLRTELKGEMDSLRTELKGEIEKLGARIDKLTYTLIAGLVGLVATHYLG
jgi:DNA repair exonuclease SbcCD ATPase subunit